MNRSVITAKSLPVPCILSPPLAHLWYLGVEVRVYFSVTEPQDLS